MAHVTQNEGTSSRSSSVNSQMEDDTDGDRMIAVVLSEEYANLDGGVGRRLTSLSSMPHVPRINTYIPTVSDASQDHQRLHERLNTYGLFEVKVSGDGNCQFRALSDQLYRSPDYHKHIRKEVVKQLKQFRSLYEGHVPMKYKQYYKKMAKSGEWGDHVTLQAAADKELDASTMVVAALGHAVNSQSRARGHYRQPRKWTVRIVDEKDKVIKTSTFCVKGKTDLQPRASSSAGSSSGMTFPACLQVTPDTTSSSKGYKDEGCFCCGQIGHKLKYCPYK